MQNKLPLFAILAAGVSFQAMADISVSPLHSDPDHIKEDSGIVRFHGNVFASPCVLSSESRFQDVSLGDISARSFHSAGDRSQPVTFKVYLRDCLKGAATYRNNIAASQTGQEWRTYTTSEQAVQMTFIGESDPGNSSLLRTTGSSFGAGLRLMSVDGKPYVLNQTQAPLLVKTGDSVLTFQAALESTDSSVTAGEFSGLMRIKMEYL
ncbi:type 1 fimbrial protein [Enterobacteriaceae bacterium 4M9]|nr:type 1 fimbrial protein [Enterobacteriaceae bacterium 4M9]